MSGFRGLTFERSLKAFSPSSDERVYSQKDMDEMKRTIRSEALEEVAVMFENEQAFMYAAAIRGLK